MIILIVETYDSNIHSPSIALDNYFGLNQSEIKTWLQKLKYFNFMSNKVFQKEGINQWINLKEKIHLVLVGVNSIDIGNSNDKIIIYPFDKSNTIKNKIIKDILARQLLTEDLL